MRSGGVGVHAILTCGLLTGADKSWLPDPAIEVCAIQQWNPLNRVSGRVSGESRCESSVPYGSGV
jgi:hypothetical protein